MRGLVYLAGLMAVAMFMAGDAYAHCEVPCGIYDDKARVEEMYEHIDTIKKAMDQIVELSDSEEKNHNQIVRWVTTKDDHARKFQNIVQQYFMTQRIKPIQSMDDNIAHKKYAYELTLLHQMLVSAMKSKQTTDLSHTNTMQETLKKFSDSYFGEDININ